MVFSIELKELVKSLNNKEKLCAMLAPSFPVDFSYPQIIGKLKRAGFAKVIEVARGAVETNKAVIKELKKDRKKRIITSPCPTCVRYLKAEEPQLVPYLSKADSPMVAAAKLVLRFFPGLKPVFIGPCLTKKLEAKEYPRLNILAITFKELVELFDFLKIKDESSDQKAKFDLVGGDTRLYPLSGALCQTAGIDELLASDQWQMASGLPALKKALQEFKEKKDLRVLDILFCSGGCLSGPGIISQKSLKEKRQKIIDYWSKHTFKKRDEIIF